MKINYENIFEGMPCYLTVQDKNLKIIAANKKIRDDFDIETGLFCYEAYKDYDKVCSDCPVLKTFETGKIQYSEQVVIKKNGEKIWVIVNTSPIRNEKGDIIAVQEMSTDITSVKNLQQKYRTLFDEVPCYISVQDKSLRILETNKMFRNAFGDSMGELCYETYKHRTEECMNCPVAETFNDGEIHQSEEVIKTKQGKLENVICYTTPIKNAANEIISVMEMSTNITKLREVQSQLTSLGMLVGSVAHGIKGIINGLDGGIYLVDSGLKRENTDRVEQGWSMIKRNVERIRSMIMNVLFYTKDREVYYENIDTEEITESILEIMINRAEVYSVKINTDINEGEFMADQHAFHSMLINLLENSIDACRHDKKDVEHFINFSIQLNKTEAVFIIEDNGLGMDRESCEKAFSLFFSSKGAEGSGLGLFISDRIVKKHNGTITINSKKGTGTKFTVKIPRYNQ